jgi:hypothetical protein
METIKINELTEREGKKGKFWSIVTNRGKFTIFDKALADNLKVGKIYEVEVIQNGLFRNLSKVIKEVESIPMTEKDIAIEQASEDKQKSVCESYAKDMYVAEITALMSKCKDLTEAKQAITERRGQVIDTANALFKAISEMPIDKIVIEKPKEIKK